MARSRARKPKAPIRVDDEVEADEGDGGGIQLEDGDDELDEPDPEFERVEKIRQAVSRAAGDVVAVSVERAIPGRGTFKLDTLNLESDEVDSFKDVVVKHFGGSGDGEFRCEFRCGGKFCGVARFKAEGDPIPVRRQAPPSDGRYTSPAADGDASPRSTTTQAQPTLTMSEVAALVSQQLEEARARDRAAALERENAELRAAARAPATVLPGPSAAEQVSQMTNLVFDRVSTLAKAGRAEKDPEVEALKASQVRLEAELKASREKDAERERKDAERRFARLEKRLAEPKKASPIKEATASMAEFAMFASAIQGLVPRGGDDEGGGLDMGEIFKPFEKVLAKLVRAKLAAVVEEVDGKAGGRTIDVAAKPNPDEWLAWLTELLTKPENALDEGFARTGLAKFGPYVNRLIGCTDRGAVLELVRETLPRQVFDSLVARPAEEIAQALKTVGALRGTVVQLAARAAAPPAPQPKASDAVEEDDDELEGDGTGDDAGDTESG